MRIPSPMTMSVEDRYMHMYCERVLRMTMCLYASIARTPVMSDPITDTVQSVHVPLLRALRESGSFTVNL